MRRVIELDALRGLAALGVAVYHLRPQSYDFGWPRVDLFLVLSGFLITALVLKYGDAPGFARSFFTRRALRIWPVYFLALASILIINPFVPTPFPLNGLPYYLTFLQNTPYYWTDSVPPFHWYFLHTWSLAIEEQFYLVWPFVVRWAGRWRLVPLTLVLATMSMTLRALGVHPWLLLARCDGLVLGGLLSALVFDPEWLRRHQRSWLWGFLGLGSASLGYLIVAARRYGPVDFTVGLSFWPALRVTVAVWLYVSLIALVLVGSGRPVLAVLRHPALTSLGKISYGIYIYHALIFVLVAVTARRLGIEQNLRVELLMLLGTVVVAALSWRWVERPILSLKARVPYGGPFLKPVAPARGLGATVSVPG